MAPSDTQAVLLDAAQELVQVRGYNAFSFRDLAERVGIKSASIHYYFPSKGDLCRALLVRYRQRFNAALADIDRRGRGPRRKLKSYTQLFRDTLEMGNRMCLCGMLAADLETLPPQVHEELRGFFTDNQEWLAKVLTEGQETGKARFDGDAKAEACLIVSGLEGAMLVARLYGDLTLFESMARRLIARLWVR